LILEEGYQDQNRPDPGGRDFKALTALCQSGLGGMGCGYAA